jgi:hypothetical protein
MIDKNKWYIAKQIYKNTDNLLKHHSIIMDLYFIILIYRKLKKVGNENGSC